MNVRFAKKGGAKFNSDGQICEKSNIHRCLLHLEQSTLESKAMIDIRVFSIVLLLHARFRLFWQSKSERLLD